MAAPARWSDLTLPPRPPRSAGTLSAPSPAPPAPASRRPLPPTTPPETRSWDGKAAQACAPPM
eukprot:1195538-Prorocentrum_minimum.AAC.4